MDGRLTAPRAEAAGVLSGASTLPVCPAKAGRLALVWVGSDFEADGLRHEVGRRRGIVISSDLPEIPSGGFMKTTLFQRPLPEPDRPLSQHPALQAWNLVCASLLIPLRFAPSGTRSRTFPPPCGPSPCPGHYPRHLITTAALPPCGSPRLGGPTVSRLRWSVRRSPRSLDSPHHLRVA